MDTKSSNRLKYGETLNYGNVVPDKIEISVIRKMKALREEGFSYWKIADILNTMKIPTKTLPHHVMMINASLGGQNLPFNGQIPVFRGKKTRIPGGGTALFLDESEEVKQMRLWEHGAFSEDDYRFAMAWRKRQPHLKLTALFNNLKQRRKKLPRLDSIDEVAKYTWFILSKPTNQEFHIRQILMSVGRRGIGIEYFVKQWKRAGSPHILEFARYAHYVHWVNLTFILGSILELLPTAKKSKSNLDLEYVYYLPFTKVFCSADKFHKKLVPAVIPEKKLFVNAITLKNDIKRIMSFLDSLPDKQKAEKMRETYSKPPPADGSVVCDIWNNYYRLD